MYLYVLIKNQPSSKTIVTMTREILSKVFDRLDKVYNSSVRPCPVLSADKPLHGYPTTLEFKNGRGRRWNISGVIPNCLDRSVYDAMAWTVPFKLHLEEYVIDRELHGLSASAIVSSTNLIFRLDGMVIPPHALIKHLPPGYCLEIEIKKCNTKIPKIDTEQIGILFFDMLCTSAALSFIPFQDILQTNVSPATAYGIVLYAKRTLQECIKMDPMVPDKGRMDWSSILAFGNTGEVHFGLPVSVKVKELLHCEYTHTKGFKLTYHLSPMGFGAPKYYPPIQNVTEGSPSNTFFAAIKDFLDGKTPRTNHRDELLYAYLSSCFPSHTLSCSQCNTNNMGLVAVPCGHMYCDACVIEKLGKRCNCGVSVVCVQKIKL